ncbi:MAG: thiamine phosphate synthase [Emcibacter sp.]|nr:thiamine phosphate synthase [Emcibacter sp.]
MTLTDIAQRLNQDYRSRCKYSGNLPPAFFITDQKAVPQPEKIIARLPDNTAVIFRDYDHPTRETLGHDLVRACHARDLLFLVAGDRALAEALGADGIHLPEALTQHATEIRAMHPNWLITVACHSLSALKQVESLSIDAALVSPVFPTLSHPETLSGTVPTLGVTGVEAYVTATSLPLYALGGITQENAPQLKDTGLAGLAAIRGFGGENTA